MNVRLFTYYNTTLRVWECLHIKLKLLLELFLSKNIPLYCLVCDMTLKENESNAYKVISHFCIKSYNRPTYYFLFDTNRMLILFCSINQYSVLLIVAKKIHYESLISIIANGFIRFMSIKVYKHINNTLYGNVVFMEINKN